MHDPVEQKLDLTAQIAQDPDRDSARSTGVETSALQGALPFASEYGVSRNEVQTFRHYAQSPLLSFAEITLATLKRSPLSAQFNRWPRRRRGTSESA